MNINRNLVIFLIASGLAVGSVLVYAKSHMSDSKQVSASQGLSQFGGQSTPDSSAVSSSPVNQVNQQSDVLGQQTAQANQSQNQTQQTQQNSNQQQAAQPAPAIDPASVKELQIKDVVVGSGEAVKSGDTAEVNYLGTFLDGKKFDSSYDRNQTFSFNVGAGSVIKGWDMGLVGMKIGGKRELLIPSDLAYGAQGAPGAIPPNTPLKFEIELVSIK